MADEEEYEPIVQVDGRSGSTTPLLGDSEQGLKPHRTPLPIVQMLLLCVVRLAEPVAYTQIFPYINDMCVKMGYAKSEDEVGFISGLIDSIFAFVQLFTVIHWGRLSDRVGRKPVLIFGLCGITIATLTFGLSQTLWLTILARCLAGGLSGNGAVIQSMISEMTDETNEARVFPLYSLTWALGSIIGPTIGGSLARPADRWPSVFGGVPLWEDYPYLLPCLVSACITGVSIFTSIFLKETLPSKVRKREKGTSTPGTPAYGTMTPAERLEEEAFDLEPTPTFWQILRSPAVPSVLITSFMMMFVNQAWDVVFILYAYTHIRSGGLSLSNAQIGYSLAGAGLIGVNIHLFLFPIMQRRFGIPMYPFLLALLLPMYIGAPVLNWLVRTDGAQRERGDVVPATFVGVAFLLGMGRLAAMIFPLNMILVKRAAPSKKAMGQTYGLAQMVTASARAVSPWFVSSLFAWSIEKNILYGHFVWAVMVGIVFVSVAQSWRIAQVVKRAERGKGDATPRTLVGE